MTGFLRHHVTTAALLAGGVAVAVLAGCSSSGHSHRATATGAGSAGATPGTSATAPPAAGSTAASDAHPSAGRTPKPPAGPALVAWGATAGVLSIVVQNQSALAIVSAHVLITALDSSSNPVASTSGFAGSKCCTILGLPPGKRFGLFANFGDLTERVAAVQVSYLDVKMAPWDPARAGAVSVLNPVLGTEDDGNAVVTATLRATGPVGPFVVGQAFLAGPDGRLIGVISGRFYCFANGVSGERAMQFLHPVPSGTRITGVAAYPIPAGQPTDVTATCS